MTENEKKLLQAKHRLEEAEMRDRQKERKARTRRLIQVHTPDQQLHLHGILAPPCRKGAPLH
ncbi:hypothetical protein AALB19_17670, partial [Oscillospiraceae bacterium 50-58]